MAFTSSPIISVLYFSSWSYSLASIRQPYHEQTFHRRFRASTSSPAPPLKSYQSSSRNNPRPAETSQKHSKQYIRLLAHHFPRPLLLTQPHRPRSLHHLASARTRRTPDNTLNICSDGVYSIRKSSTTSITSIFFKNPTCDFASRFPTIISFYFYLKPRGV